MAHAASRFATDFDGERVLRKEITRAYRRGRRAMRRALETRATADLHRWRKATKHLWHLLTMAKASVPRRSARLAVRLDGLAELLGLDHDHAMLAERLPLAPDGATLSRRLALIAERRRGIADEALALGGALYALNPRRFGKRYGLTAG
jgi:hypothetical protein